VFGPGFESLRLHSLAVTSNKTASCGKIEPETEPIISKAPKLNDYGGDLSKRWYIDTFTETGERKKLWIASKPLHTRAARAKKEIQKIIKLFKGSDYNFATILAKMPIKKKSRQTYQSDINILLSYCPDLNSLDVELFKNYLVETYHPNTVRNKIKNLKAVFAFSVEEGYLKINPFKDVKNIAKQKDSEKNFPFTEYERSVLEPALKQFPELYLFTRFVYYTFSRIQELKELKVRDINLRTRTITLKADTVKTERTLVKPIVSPLLDFILESGVLNNPGHYYVFGKGLKPGAERCPVNYATNEHKKVLESCKIYRKGETTLYGWKHTGNINAYLANMDIKLIQKINGHSSLETTEIYLSKLGLFLDKRAY
jgi:integrase